MTTKEIMEYLASKGSESVKQLWMKHGAVEPFFGVKGGDLKLIQKKIKKDHEISLELYATGNSDAMYLAGLIADESKMTKAILRKWADQATWSYISESAVPWIASDSGHGFELALEWIDSTEEKVQACGWSTLNNYASITPNNEIDIEAYSKLLDRVKSEIHDAANRTRYTMNGFVIGTGTYIEALTEKALKTASEIGKVNVFMGETACKVPDAIPYIEKIQNKGSIGKKRKKARC